MSSTALPNVALRRPPRVWPSFIDSCSVASPNSYSVSLDIDRCSARMLPDIQSCITYLGEGDDGHERKRKPERRRPSRMLGCWSAITPTPVHTSHHSPTNAKGKKTINTLIQLPNNKCLVLPTKSSFLPLLGPCESRLPDPNRGCCSPCPPGILISFLPAVLDVDASSWIVLTRWSEYVRLIPRTALNLAEGRGRWCER
jgi:hypothetical protein